MPSPVATGTTPAITINKRNQRAFRQSNRAQANLNHGQKCGSIENCEIGKLGREVEHERKFFAVLCACKRPSAWWGREGSPLFKPAAEQAAKN